MSSYEIVLYIFIGVVSSLVWSHLKIGTTKPVHKGIVGEYIFRMSPVYWLFGIFIIALISIAMMINPSKDFYTILLFLLFTSTGLYVLIFGLNHKVILYEDYFLVSDLFGRKTKWQWEEIEKVKHKPSISQIQIKGSSKINNIHSHLIGSQHFFQKLKDNTD